MKSKYEMYEDTANEILKNKEQPIAQEETSGVHKDTSQNVGTQEDINKGKENQAEENNQNQQDITSEENNQNQQDITSDPNMNSITFQENKKERHLKIFINLSSETFNQYQSVLSSTYFEVYSKLFDKIDLFPFSLINTSENKKEQPEPLIPNLFNNILSLLGIKMHKIWTVNSSDLLNHLVTSKKDNNPNNDTYYLLLTSNNNCIHLFRSAFANIPNNNDNKKGKGNVYFNYCSQHFGEPDNHYIDFSDLTLESYNYVFNRGKYENIIPTSLLEYIQDLKTDTSKLIRMKNLFRTSTIVSDRLLSYLIFKNLDLDGLLYDEEVYRLYNTIYPKDLNLLENIIKCQMKKNKCRKEINSLKKSSEYKELEKCRNNLLSNFGDIYL